MPEKPSLAKPSGLFFEEFEVGQSVVTLGRTITEADVVSFAALSGDWNPIHSDAVYAAQTPFGQRVAHGLLGVSIAVSLAMRLGFLEETLLAFREIDEWKFSLPIFIGDTIHASLEVKEKKSIPRLGAGMVSLRVELVNQKDQVLQQGVWRVLMKSRENQLDSPG